MPVGKVCDESETPQSEALWGEEEQRNERTATNRSGERYEACDDDERTKMGENVIAAKAWQERLSLKRQKTAQSRNGEFVICPVWITISNHVTLSNEQYSLYSEFILILMKHHAKPRN